MRSNVASALSGSPRVTAIIREGWKSTIARPVGAATTAIVVAAVCVFVLLTTGRAAATEASVMASIDSVGTRLVTVTDTTGHAGIGSGAVADVASLASVDWVFGLGPAFDVRNSDLTGAGSGVSARTVSGRWDLAVELDSGRRLSHTSEAIVGAAARDALRLGDASGSLQGANGDRVGVVGIFSSSGAFANLNEMVLIQAEQESTEPLRYLYVLASPGADIDEVSEAIAAIVPAQRPGDVEVSVSQGALDLRDVVSGKLGAGTRQLMAIVLVAGLLLVTITIVGAVAGRRRDFGRMRALGASRSAVMVLVLISSALSGAAGVVVGMGVGLVVSYATSGALPSAGFACGVAWLALLVTTVGSVPPAIAAAYRDPVRILRVP